MLNFAFTNGCKGTNNICNCQIYQNKGAEMQALGALIRIAFEMEGAIRSMVTGVDT